MIKWEKFRKKSQSMVEYTLIIGTVALALTFMSTYGQRGIQSVIKLSADNLGSQKPDLEGSTDIGGEPYYFAGDIWEEGEATLRGETRIARQGLESEQVEEQNFQKRLGMYIEVESEREYLGGILQDKELR